MMRLFFGAILVALVAACASQSPLPPGPPAAKVASMSLVNPGFESTVVRGNGDPEGWFSYEHAIEPSYKFVIDATNPHSGLRSLRIDNYGPDVYGAVAQSLDAFGYAGKTARFSGWLRTREASEGGAVQTVTALMSGATLAHNFMEQAPVRGTTGWQRYTITLRIPAGTDRVEVGAMLQGKGSLWLDDVELQLE